MTESFGPYCGDRLDTDMPRSKWGSCGRPFEGIDVRVADPDTCRGLPAGSEGEIQLRGRNLMRGICGRTRSELFTLDGFYRTRDLGRLDDDGYLWYVGRLDDMFKVKGATVYPTEVEAALRSTPGVSQAFVTNVATDAGLEQVGALVVSDVDTRDIVGALRARLSSFKVPTVWLVAADPSVAPMSATGKIDKERLQELLVQRGTPAPP